jgi:hypothetical protein
MYRKAAPPASHPLGKIAGVEKQKTGAEGREKSKKPHSAGFTRKFTSYIHMKIPPRVKVYFDKSVLSPIKVLGIV